MTGAQCTAHSAADGGAVALHGGGVEVAAGKTTVRRREFDLKLLSV